MSRPDDKSGRLFLFMYIYTGKSYMKLASQGLINFNRNIRK